MASPFVATSRLSNIIQMITLSRQTGILRVLRGQGAIRELGQIRFLDGEPVAALLGQLTGGAALSVLSNWGECLYAFDELTVAETADPTMPSPPDWGGGYPGSNPGSGPSGYGGYGGDGGYGGYGGSTPGRQSPTTPLSAPQSASSWPVYGYQYQQSGPLGAPASGPFADLAALAAYGTGAPGPAPAPAYSQPSLGVSGSGMPPSGAANGAMSGPPGWGRPATATGLLTVVPQRTAVAEQIDQLPLDRRERMVLLLVDGQRTVADLARLTRRSEAELQAVLTHLELLGLVWLGR